MPKPSPFAAEVTGFADEVQAMYLARAQRFRERQIVAMRKTASDDEIVAYRSASIDAAEKLSHALRVQIVKLYLQATREFF